MYWLSEVYIALRDFMESGGTVLWYIALLVTFMWALILERVYYFLFVHEEIANGIQKKYLAMNFKSPWHKFQIKTRLISEGKISINKNMQIIQVCIALYILLFSSVSLAAVFVSIPPKYVACSTSSIFVPSLKCVSAFPYIPMQLHFL